MNSDIFLQRAQERQVSAKNLNQNIQIPEQPKTSLPDLFSQRAQERIHPQQEEKKSDLLRHPARIGSRILETAVGLPGDIQNFLGDLLIGGAEFVAGEELPRFRHAIKGPPKGTYSSGNFPTSEELKQFSEQSTKGFTSPKTENERKLDELVQDLTAFALPGPGKMSITKKIGIPILANLTKEGVNWLDFGEKEQAYAKLGTMIGLSLSGASRKNVKDHIGKLIGESEQLVSEGSTLSSKPILDKLEPIKKKMERGGSAPSKTEALKKIEEIEKKSVSGQMPVHDAIEFKKNINEIKEKLGGFDIGKTERERALHNLNEIYGALDKGLETYGKGQNPEFLRLNKQANQAFAVYENSNKIHNFIEKNYGKKLTSTGAKILFGLGAASGSYLNPVVAGVSLGGAGVYQTGKLLYRINQSPILRKYYSKVITESLKGNAREMSKNLEKLDNELKKEEIKNPV